MPGTVSGHVDAESAGMATATAAPARNCSATAAHGRTRSRTSAVLCPMPATNATSGCTSNWVAATYRKVTPNGTAVGRPVRCLAPSLRTMDVMALVDPLLAVMTSLDGLLPMIPSEAAVLASGVFAHGSARSLMFVVVATALGVFAGDHLAYGLSRSVLGPRLVGRFRHVARAVAAARRQL